jgi:hypothetical protein
MNMEETPSWMQCQDILIRIKEELVLEAVDALHRELDAKRLEMNGAIPINPEENANNKKDMFMIGNLLENYEDMQERYSTYIKETEAKDSLLDAHTIARIEELKKFLLSVAEIKYLMDMAYDIDEWVTDVGKPNGPSTASGILLESVKIHSERAEILRYAAKSKRFEASHALSKEETDLLNEILAKLA